MRIVLDDGEQLVGAVPVFYSPHFRILAQLLDNGRAHGGKGGLVAAGLALGVDGWLDIDVVNLVGEVGLSRGSGSEKASQQGEKASCLHSFGY